MTHPKVNPKIVSHFELGKGPVNFNKMKQALIDNSKPVPKQRKADIIVEVNKPHFPKIKD